ncbi:MAG: thioredoxin [Bacilli bacterium]|nr:thioredoxin [Bacilli bacterium]
MKFVNDLKDLTEKLTLVDFFATWCGPCKMIAPLLEELDERNPDLDVFKVDVDEAEDLAREFNINSIPTLILFKDKKPIEKAVGYMDLDKLQKWVNSKK